jgi:hypothetical protein
MHHQLHRLAKRLEVGVVPGVENVKEAVVTGNDAAGEDVQVGVRRRPAR